MKSLLILALALGLSSSVLSQGFGFELFGGLTNYQGDLRQRIFTFQGSRPAFGVGVSYAVNGHLAFRLGFKRGTLGADDRLNKDSAIFFRNLSFQTEIVDVEAVMIYSLFKDDASKYNFYAFAGVGGFAYDPFTIDQFGITRRLQPLGTEGQGLPGYPEKELYSLRQMNIPFGIGLQYNIGSRLGIAWEFTFRKTFTDYIDDLSTNYADQFDLLFGRGPLGVVAADLSYRGDEMILIDPNVPYSMPKGSKRGNPGAKDLYYFTGLNLRYSLARKETRGTTGFGNPRSRKGTECPKW